MNSPIVGNRVRIDCQGHAIDGLTGCLERIEGGVGYVLRGETLYSTPVANLRTKGVLQGPRTNVSWTGQGAVRNFMEESAYVW